ncbi:MAG TPA: hypothetical protein VGG39_17675 [Polyangiaceae bacterium]|jgi:hypothetical protein
MNTNGKSHDELATAANRARTKLLHTIEQLDHRRHEILEPRVQIIEHTRELVIAGGVLLAATAAGIGLAVYRARSAPRRRWRGRWALARDVWRRPDRAMHGERRSFLEEALRSVLMTLLTAAVTIPARRLLTELVEGKLGQETPASR